MHVQHHQIKKFFKRKLKLEDIEEEAKAEEDIEEEVKFEEDIEEEVKV